MLTSSLIKLSFRAIQMNKKQILKQEQTCSMSDKIFRNHRGSYAYLYALTTCKQQLPTWLDSVKKDSIVEPL